MIAQEMRIMARRSKRSVIEPATRPTIKLGAERAANMAPTIPALPVMSNTSHPSSTCCMPRPNWLETVENHRTRKSA